MNPNQPFVLLADVGQIIGVIVFLLFLMLWVIGQIAEANKKAAAQRGNRPAAPPTPPPAAGGAPGGQQADPLRQQMDEFLRRARQQAGQPEASVSRPQPAADRIEILLDESHVVRERQPAQQPRTATPPAAKPRPPAKQRTKVRRLVPRGEGVAQHVAQHLDGSRQAVAQSAAQLGQRIIEEDKQFDVQLKAKFDHELGTLATERGLAVQQQPATEPAVTSLAASIAAMLANPDGVRQAVVLNEVLQRPVDRW